MGGHAVTRPHVFAVVLLALTLLASVPAASAPPPKRGGVLRIAEREAPSLDPHLNMSFLTLPWPPQCIAHQPA